MAAEIICPKCEYMGKPAKRKRGSGRTEVYAWLAFPFGVPYSLWRMLSKYPVCPDCGNTLLIEADTPLGQKLKAKIEDELVSVKPIAKPSAPVTAVPVAAVPAPVVKAPPPEQPVRTRQPVNPDEW